MAFGRYILDSDKNPVICLDNFQWNKWMSENDRTIIKTEREDLLISTIFLGSDHGCEGNVLVFETMVFDVNVDSGADKYCDRYGTYQEAVDGHIRTCKMFLTNYTEGDVFVDMI